MTVPDLIHFWRRAGSDTAGQWVALTAPESALAFAAEGATMQAVRRALDRAAEHIERGDDRAALVLRELRAARRMIGGE